MYAAVPLCPHKPCPSSLIDRCKTKSRSTHENRRFGHHGDGAVIAYYCGQKGMMVKFCCIISNGPAQSETGLSLTERL